MSIIPANAHITYQHQYRKCGKPTCRCKRGQPHGPYWYAYARVNGKLTARYVGKDKPEEVR